MSLVFNDVTSMKTRQLSLMGFTQWSKDPASAMVALPSREHSFQGCHRKEGNWKNKQNVFKVKIHSTFHWPNIHFHGLKLSSRNVGKSRSPRKGKHMMNTWYYHYNCLSLRYERIFKQKFFVVYFLLYLLLANSDPSIEKVSKNT
jgi:hypothetical protein